MTRPRLLDAFCGAGGCSRGYTLAGFECVGVDIAPQPHYLASGGVAFVQADALEFIAAHGHEYDAIHASPPCQRYSQLFTTMEHKRGDHPDLLDSTRDALVASGRPWRSRRGCGG